MLYPSEYEALKSISTAPGETISSKSFKTDVSPTVQDRLTTGGYVERYSVDTPPPGSHYHVWFRLTDLGRDELLLLEQHERNERDLSEKADALERKQSRRNLTTRVISLVGLAISLLGMIGNWERIAPALSALIRSVRECFH